MAWRRPSAGGPALLLPDEPVADLDPLARHRLMGALTADAAEHGTAVVMSSHIPTEPEGVCTTARAELAAVRRRRPARGCGGAGMSALTLKGPYWVTVRRHRRVLWAVPAFVAAALAVMVALRVGAGDPYSEPSSVSPPDREYGLLRPFLQPEGGAPVFLPALVGAFVAGPMTARELESGTWRLALSQSTTARAWLGAEVAAAGVSVLVACRGGRSSRCGR
ncbi:hypothetical protein ACFXG6_15575 [Streptomyces roseus]|uniref:hypothetical protein n=1 Tax=Streptomyces roseus TaxID=66430 RepID=UPI003699E7E5